MNNETAGQKVAADVTALLRARNALLWVVTPEETRVERALIEAAAKANYETRLWDCIAGVTNGAGEEVPPGTTAQDPAAMLAAIRNSKERAVWVLRDLHQFLKDPFVLRAIRNLAKTLPMSPMDEARTIIVLTPSSEVPPELIDHAIVVKWQLPDREEIADVFDTAISGLEPNAYDTDEKRAARAALYAEALSVREAAIEAAVGLSTEAASACYSKSLVTQKKRVVPSIIAAEKRRVINREKGIEWFDPDPRGLDALGGLDNLKPWLLSRKAGFTQRARDYGLPLPKGVFLTGVAGCGKSLAAKATATAFDCPLLRADFGGAQSKWVGESQQNIRAVFAVAEAVGRCVLWIDEIEKALAGATGGAADGGVSADALGTFLTWMQERKGAVFVIATSNDVSKLPPELLRKGRWDDLFFVDLPTESERREILSVSLTKYKRQNANVDITSVARACAEFTGAEIDALVPEAMFKAFADDERDITTSDLIVAVDNTTPMAKTSKEKVDALREWAKRTQARPASKPEVVTANKKGGRVLDM